METFWFFWLRLRRAYDSAYDSNFWFSLGHKRSYDSANDSDSDSVASENQPLTFFPFFFSTLTIAFNLKVNINHWAFILLY